MKRVDCLFLLMMISAFCVAQTTHLPIQVNGFNTGSYSKNFGDAFSFTTNQALLSSQPGISAGMYAERKFSLSELGFYSFAVSIPLASGGIGVQADYFGFADYNESMSGIAYGKKLGKLIDMGVQFDYNTFHIAGYGNINAINFEVGTLIHPSEKITFGLHAYNPVGGRIGKNINEKIASIYEFGFAYDVSEQVGINVRMTKIEDRPAFVNGCLQYAFAKQFFTAIGIETLSASPYGALGLHWKKFRADILAAYHTGLGFTPGLKISIDSFVPTNKD